MAEKELLELTTKTITEVDRVLKMTGSEYIKEFPVETERVDKAKIEKVENMIGSLKFFIDSLANK